MVVIMQDYGHSLGVDWRHDGVRLGSKETIGIAALGRAPNAGEGKDRAAWHVEPVQRLFAILTGSNPVLRE